MERQFSIEHREKSLANLLPVTSQATVCKASANIFNANDKTDEQDERGSTSTGAAYEICLESEPRGEEKSSSAKGPSSTQLSGDGDRLAGRKGTD